MVRHAPLSNRIVLSRPCGSVVSNFGSAELIWIEFSAFLATLPPFVKPTITLAETTAPNGANLALIEHDGDYYLQADGVQFQSSFAHNAAVELSRMGCAPLRSARQPHLLFAGLGLGFTLAAAREALPQKRAVFQVAETIEAMPSWHRKFLGGLHPGQVDDPRLGVHTQSLQAAFRKQSEGFHAILLDAEGSLPIEGVTDTKGVPHSSFLHRAHSALKEGALLAIVCLADHKSFERKLRQVGFDVTSEIVPTSHKGKQKQRSTIWLARKGSYQPRESN
jgi:spermidine synthase